MNISVYFKASDLSSDKVKRKNAAVIDVLRATSVITTAIENGAKAIVPFKSIEEAVNYKKRAGEQIFLGGERNSDKIQGFDFGNSPLEYTREAVAGKTIAMTTTNGTNAIEGAKDAQNLYIMSFLNLQAVCELLVKQGQDIALVCAGTNGCFSLDDALCAGKAVSYISYITEHVFLDDASVIVKGYYEKSGKDLGRLIQDATHYKNLMDMDYDKDVAHCILEDIFDVVPVYKNGFII